MTIRTRGLAGAIMAVVVFLASVVVAADPEWTPSRWKDEQTLNLCTSVPGEGGYCFPVWLVVLDDQVYVRLGTKAADRVTKNTTGMVLPVEIMGHRFEQVQGISVPESADRVAAAMADKYWSDIFVRFMSHPLTLRLEPAGSAPATP